MIRVPNLLMLLSASSFILGVNHLIVFGPAVLNVLAILFGVLGAAIADRMREK